jgi:hypothetical protein
LIGSKDFCAKLFAQSYKFVPKFKRFLRVYGGTLSPILTRNTSVYSQLRSTHSLSQPKNIIFCDFSLYTQPSKQFRLQIYNNEIIVIIIFIFWFFFFQLVIAIRLGQQEKLATTLAASARAKTE